MKSVEVAYFFKVIVAAFLEYFELKLIVIRHPSNVILINKKSATS